MEWQMGYSLHKCEVLYFGKPEQDVKALESVVEKRDLRISDTSRQGDEQDFWHICLHRSRDLSTGIEMSPYSCTRHW